VQHPARQVAPFNEVPIQILFELDPIKTHTDVDFWGLSITLGVAAVAVA